MQYLLESTWSSLESMWNYRVHVDSTWSLWGRVKYTWFQHGHVCQVNFHWTVGESNSLQTHQLLWLMSSVIHTANNGWLGNFPEYVGVIHLKWVGSTFHDCKKRGNYLKISASRVFKTLKTNPDSQQMAPFLSTLSGLNYVSSKVTHNPLQELNTK